MKHNMFFLFNKTKTTGEKGEEKAVYFLKKKGFKILERNYRKPWGEIDIVALKDNVIHIVEVKAFTETKREGDRNDFDEPSDRLTREKIRRLVRIAETYIKEKGIEEKEWQIDLIFVSFLLNGGEHIEFMENPTF
jgi:putative endonuclease